MQPDLLGITSFKITVNSGSQLNAVLKRCVLRLRLKLARVLVDLTDSGRVI